MIIDSKKQSTSDAALPNYDADLLAQQGRHQPTPKNYVFTPWSGTSMDLIPQSTDYGSNQRPLYRITVGLDLNPLVPSSYTTRIVRCRTNEQAEAPVGEFTFALDSKFAVLRMGNTSTKLSRILYSVNSSPKHFNWFLNTRLHWDCRTSQRDGSPICICYIPSPDTPADPRAPPAQPPTGWSDNSSMSGTSIHIATLISPPPDSSPPMPDATLTIFPMGQSLMDEILISSLVIERMLVR